MVIHVRGSAGSPSPLPNIKCSSPCWLDAPSNPHETLGMRTVTVQEARRQFDEMMEWVARGEEVELSSGARAIARLVPATSGDEDREVDWSCARTRLSSLWSGELA